MRIDKMTGIAMVNWQLVKNAKNLSLKMTILENST